jgi:hypothetical protein
VKFLIESGKRVGWAECNEAQQNSKSKPSGAARQLVTFLASPRKVTQRRRPQFRHPCGIPCVARQAGLPHKLARSASQPRAQTCSSEFPGLPVLLSGGYGDPKSKAVRRFCVRAHCALTFFLFLIWCTLRANRVWFFAFRFLYPHVRRREKSSSGGGVGEDCLSTQCEFRSPG